MCDQQDNNIQMNDSIQQLPKRRSRNFYRRRPAGSERQDQYLGEDENRALPDDDDTNNSEDNDNHMNNIRGRGQRGNFRRFRGRGRFARAMPFFDNFHRVYSPYGNGGFITPQGRFYGSLYPSSGYPLEQNGINVYPVRGNRGLPSRRRRPRRQHRINKNENMDHPSNDDQQQNEDKTNTKNQQRQRRRANDNGSDGEQQIDDVTNDRHQDENKSNFKGKQQRRKSNRRRNRNRNTNQSEVENERLEQEQKSKDDHVIVKNVVRSMVNKVARRVAPRHRRRSHANAKEVNDKNNIDIEQSRPSSARRGRRSGRPGSGYFIEPGYFDPYGMAYYYGMYYGHGGRGLAGRDRGRGRDRFRRRRGANKENQYQHNSEQEKFEESNLTGDDSQSKTTISEQVNQLSKSDDLIQ